MKTLLLWRHAKARPGGAAQDDADRPLSDRGEGAAATIARARATALAGAGVILCSPAVRTRQTLSAADSVLEGVPCRFEKGLYLAPPLDLLARAARLEEDHAGALFVGHNPGLDELVRLLVRDGDETALASFAEGFKAGALAELRLEVALWREVGAGCATLETFTRPRDLGDSP
jgi:phosphohistidine phosphatase